MPFCFLSATASLLQSHPHPFTSLSTDAKHLALHLQTLGIPDLSVKSAPNAPTGHNETHPLLHRLRTPRARSHLQTPMTALVRAYTLATVATFLWGTTATVVALAPQDVNPLRLLLLEQLWVLLSLPVVMLSAPAQARAQMQKLQISLSTVSTALVFILLATLTGTFYAAHNFLYYFAIRHAPSFQTNAIVYLWPVILSIFFRFSHSPKLPPRTRQSFATRAFRHGPILVAFLGALLIFYSATSSAHAQPFAYLAALASAFSAPAYMLLMLALARRYQLAMLTTFYVTIAPSILITVLLLLSTKTPFSPTGHSLALGFYLGAIVSLFAETLWARALSTDRTGQVQTAAYITPIFSFGLLALTTRTALSTTSAVGATLIILANLWPIYTARSAPASGFRH